MVTLRPYQIEAVEAVKKWCKSTTSPCVIEAPTGAGKSHVIAAIAEWLYKLSGRKSVLCIAPSAELVLQNREKFILRTGQAASLMSASAGKISLRYPVIFGTPMTIKNRVQRLDGRVCGVIIDECHRITPTIKGIIESLKKNNEYLRVIGTTATPYRLGSGYIYRQKEDGKSYGDDQARDPYFARRVYNIEARHLINEGYLTPPVIGLSKAERYDTSGLKTNKMGRFTSESVDRAFVGHGRKTSKIVAEVVEAARCREGVLFFGATVAHAREILASLPPGLSAIVTGETKKQDRKQILDDFKAKRLKYLVNVNVLTTGFDAPHVDVIALLKATESVSLFQQMIGRGLRIDAGKSDCLVLDYAGNIEKHCPHGDIFDPDITATLDRDGSLADVKCPSCGCVNQFSMLPEIASGEYEMDENGYALDLMGSRLETEWGPMPGHYGRRCNGLYKAMHSPEYIRCGYRWTYKPCPECEAPNDIAARYCSTCKEEIVNPNEKLSRNFAAFKKDPTNIQTDEITGWVVKDHLSAAGNKCKRITVTTPYRSMVLYFVTDSKSQFVARKYQQLLDATHNLATQPKTITYQKRGDFFTAIAFNRPEDVPPEIEIEAEE